MAVTLVSEREQQKFGSIERFLGYEVTKNEMPAELGQAPAYHPERRRSGGGKGFRKNGGSRENGGSHNGNRQRKQTSDKRRNPRQPRKEQ